MRWTKVLKKNVGECNKELQKSQRNEWRWWATPSFPLWGEKASIKISKTSHYIRFNTSPDLSWCHYRSSPCCQPAAPDHRVRTSTATAPSAVAAASLHRCHGAGVYRNPAHPPGPAAGCASSSVAPLNRKKRRGRGGIYTKTETDTNKTGKTTHLYCIKIKSHPVMHRGSCHKARQEETVCSQYLGVWWSSPPAEAAPQTSWPQNLQALTFGWAASLSPHWKSFMQTTQ